MRTFLQEVVTDLISQTESFEHYTLVIPGVRPKAFIQKTFLENGFHGILPKIVSIEELLEQISGLKLTSGIPLWFATYEAYKSSVDEPKSFENFLKFAPTLLKDFDDMDAALSDDKGLLDSLISEERIKQWGQSMDVGLSDLMKNHLGFWTDAQATFYALRQNLLEEGKAYRGLLSRQAYEQVDTFASRTKQHFVFVGFNALTTAELNILDKLTLEEKATAYWDADTYYMSDSKQEAGDFLRKLRQKFTTDFKFINSHFEKTKDLKIINVPKQETQAKYVGNYLKALSPELRDKTAIVLADEQILPAVLNALPDELEKLNITMGLPLQMVSIASFFKHLFQLHLSREKFEKPTVYYYTHVLDVLQHADFRHYFLPEALDLIENINKQNIVFVSKDKFQKLQKTNPFYSIFELPQSPLEFLDVLINWINIVYESDALPAMHEEYMFRFRSVFMQLKDEIEQHDFVDNFKILNQLFNQLLQAETVSFVGEPLVGLQLLGMLETRLLDFEHVILTSVNEGTLPLGRQENSFIPFDFRVNFNLNTFLENDAIYAYHFYRLIQRCKSAVFLYNSDSEGIGSGEPSRFLLQLKLESPHEVKEYIATPHYQKSGSKLLTIEKTDAVLDKLNQWKDWISPSSLGSYLYDPIQFYARKVLKISEEDEVEEIAGNMTLGTIVHEVLEQLYKPYLNKILITQDFEAIERAKDKVFNHIADKELLKGNEVRGKNILILRVAKEMINNVLRKDKVLVASNSELIIKGLEEKYKREFITPAGNEVSFYGVVDRIDEVDGALRVLDYKTGSVHAYELAMKTERLERMIEDYKGAKPIQLAIYAYMMNIERGMSGIYPLRYFSQDIHYLSLDKETELTQEKIKPLMATIGSLIDEILNPEIPFQALEEKERF